MSSSGLLSSPRYRLQLSWSGRIAPSGVSCTKEKAGMYHGGEPPCSSAKTTSRCPLETSSPSVGIGAWRSSVATYASSPAWSKARSITAGGT